MKKVLVTSGSGIVSENEGPSDYQTTPYLTMTTAFFCGRDLALLVTVVFFLFEVFGDCSSAFKSGKRQDYQRFLHPLYLQSPVRLSNCKLYLLLTGKSAQSPDWLGSDSARITGYSEATRSVEQTGHSPLTRRCGFIMEAIPSPALCSCRDA